MNFVSSQPYLKHTTRTFHNTNQRTAVIFVTAIFTLYLTVASEQHVNAQAITAHELIRLARYEKTCPYTVSIGTYQAHSKMQMNRKNANTAIRLKNDDEHSFEDDVIRSL